MHHFELSPNCSLTSRSALGFYLLVAAACLLVAVNFALLGFWPVLPFAGLELAVLWLCLRHSMRRGRDRDFIDIDAERVVVEQIRAGRSARRESFPRHWVGVRLRRARSRNALPQIEIGAGQRWLAVGEFLTARERRGLSSRLKTVLGAR